MSYIEVIHASSYALIQDLGRFGYQDIGVSTSGALDEHAYLWANKLLHNDVKSSNAIEISFGGLVLKSHANSVISVCGATAEFYINDKPCHIWQTYPIKQNDIIKVGKLKKGQKLYLSVKNGFKSEKYFGSYSVCLKEDIGQMLQDGDKLAITETYHPHHHICVPYEFIPKYKDEATFGVLLNEKYFSHKEIDKFFSSNYTVTNDRNRMGAKLSGEKIKANVGGIISEPTAYGTIQIPPNGEPIVLLKERQTIGGYPYIGQLFTLDCFRLSQLKNGATIHFEPISHESMQRQLREFYNFFYY